MSYSVVNIDDVPVTLGSFIRIDPGETRCPYAGSDGLTFIAVGARPGSYELRRPLLAALVTGERHEAVRVEQRAAGQPDRPREPNRRLVGRPGADDERTPR
jgi:hypothetical protein